MRHLPKFAVTLLALASLGAQAQTLQRVEVTGVPVRTDVHLRCPAIAVQLQQSLAPALSRAELAGEYRVDFSLRGNALDDVRAVGGEGDWAGRSAVRRAVRALDCQDATLATAPARFSFLLAVVMADDGHGGRVAQLRTRALAPARGG